MKTCTINNQDCTKYAAKGLCCRHYAKLRRTGNPLSGYVKDEHGMVDTPEYRTWCAMKQRCLNPESISYPLYGGRGIKICTKWVHSFMAFYRDMGPKPVSTGNVYSLERYDSDRDYEPGNCLWATATDQAINRGKFKNNTSGFKGVYYMEENSERPWYASIRVNKKSINLGFYSTKEEAMQARIQGELKCWGRVVKR